MTIDGEPTPPPRSRFGRWKQILTGLLTVIVVVFVVVAVQRNWSAVRDDLARLSPVDLALSAAAGALAMSLASEGWRRALASLGSRLPIRDAFTIYFAGQLGKYAPGSMWPIVIQSELGRRSNVPRVTMAASYFLALLISLACGGLTGLLVFTGDGAGSVWLIALAGGIGSLVVAALIYDARMLNSLGGWVARRAKRDVPTIPQAGPTVGAAGAFTLVSWLCFGLQAWLLARPLGAGIDLLLPTIGAFALAFVAGMVLVPLPAGAGIRETVLVIALGASIGDPAAITVSIMSRLVLILTELALAMAFGVPGAARAAKARQKLRSSGA